MTFFPTSIQDEQCQIGMQQLGLQEMSQKPKHLPLVTAINILSSIPLLWPQQKKVFFHQVVGYQLPIKHHPGEDDH